MVTRKQLHDAVALYVRPGTVSIALTDKGSSMKVELTPTATLRHWYQINKSSRTQACWVEMAGETKPLFVQTYRQLYDMFATIRLYSPEWVNIRIREICERTN